MTSKLTRLTDDELTETLRLATSGYPLPACVEGNLRRAFAELQERRKAAMDSEPVAYMWDSKRKDIDAPGFYFPEHLFFAESNAKHWGGEVISLYRHAQQPVVPDDVLDALQKVARIRLDLNDFDGDRRGIADCLCDAEEALIEVVNRRAAMLQGAENAESRCGIQTPPALDSFKKNAESRCGNSPVIPDGYVMVPKEPTQAMCAAFNDSDYGRKSLRERYVAMLAAAPREVHDGQR